LKAYYGSVGLAVKIAKLQRPEYVFFQSADISQALITNTYSRPLQ
jgi:hypothetical protein